MGWVADERGLGGARSLDGLSWDLAIDEVWEAWVATFTADLATRLGLQSTPHGGAQYRLNWAGGIQSMGALVPDVVLRGPHRVIWVDAKYKAHLSQLAQHGWRRLTEDVRSAHRADLHQALAYANLAAMDHVDTVLAYPDFGTSEEKPLFAVATMASDRRRVRLILAGLPFGFRGPDHQEKTLSAWKNALAT
jgi:5-methylcytosine-specific restriction endonuclease McrBC regulatory subunit McrC